MATSDSDLKNINDRMKYIPRFGIFGPTCSLKEGVDLEELKKRNSGGVELEFCTDEINDKLDEIINQEDAYFNTSEVLKGSYLLDEYESKEAKCFSEDLSSFARLSLTMKNLTLDGGVKKSILKEGVGAIVPDDARVHVHYNAYLEDMVEPYDSSRLRGKQLQINLGMGSVIRGLDVAIASMRKKEVARFLIQSDYAYGELGCMPRIPGNATLLFEVEVIHYLEASMITEYEESCEEDRKKFSFEKLIGIAKAEKSEGNSFYCQEMYKKALRKYMKTVNLIESIHLKSQEEEDKVVSVTCKVFLNIGLTNLKLGNFKKALAAGRRVLDYNPNYIKAMYICGTALRHIGDFKEAMRYLSEANRLAPKSKDIVHELRMVDELETSYRIMERETCKRMFNNDH